MVHFLSLTKPDDIHDLILTNSDAYWLEHEPFRLHLIWKEGLLHPHYQTLA
jgi:hypothetical protein